MSKKDAPKVFETAIAGTVLADYDRFFDVIERIAEYGPAAYGDEHIVKAVFCLLAADLHIRRARLNAEETEE